MAIGWPPHRIGATILAIVVLAFAGWILQHFLFLTPIAMALLAQWWRAEGSDWSDPSVERRPA